MVLFSGYTFPSKAPHVHIVNNGTAYDIYFAGTNFRDAFVYENSQLINTYSSSITGYVEIGGTSYTAYFPVYDYGYIRYGTSSTQYIYLNQITECDFIGFSEAGWWKHDINTYLLTICCILLFLNFIRGK